MKRWLLRLFVLLLVVVVGLVITGLVLHEDPPKGESGPFATLLAKRMLNTVQPEKWARTGAVKWNFANRRQHVWDRNRKLSRVIWDEHEVLLDLTTKKGIARTNGSEVKGAQAEKLFAKAYEIFINDSFWLNPFPKFLDEGVKLERVELDGGWEALLVTFPSGGVTPGDKYLWFHDGRYRPSRVKMWVSLLPIGGVEVTWERYQTLQTGAEVATKHDWFRPFELTDVAGAPSIDGLMTPDPFEPLVGTATSTAGPASRPSK